MRSLTDLIATDHGGLAIEVADGTRPDCWRYMADSVADPGIDPDDCR